MPPVQAVTVSQALRSSPCLSTVPRTANTTSSTFTLGTSQASTSVTYALNAGAVCQAQPVPISQAPVSQVSERPLMSGESIPLDQHQASDLNKDDSTPGGTCNDRNFTNVAVSSAVNSDVAVSELKKPDIAMDYMPPDDKPNVGESVTEHRTDTVVSHNVPMDEITTHDELKTVSSVNEHRTDALVNVIPVTEISAHGEPNDRSVNELSVSAFVSHIPVNETTRRLELNHDESVNGHRTDTLVSHDVEIATDDNHRDRSLGEHRTLTTISRDIPMDEIPTHDESKPDRSVTEHSIPAIVSCDAIRDDIPTHDDLNPDGSVTKHRTDTLVSRDICVDEIPNHDELNPHVSVNKFSTPAAVSQNVPVDKITTNDQIHPDEAANEFNRPVLASPEIPVEEFSTPAAVISDLKESDFNTPVTFGDCSISATDSPDIPVKEFSTSAVVSPAVTEFFTPTAATPDVPTTEFGTLADISVNRTENDLSTPASDTGMNEFSTPAFLTPDVAATESNAPSSVNPDIEMEAAVITPESDIEHVESGKYATISSDVAISASSVPEVSPDVKLDDHSTPSTAYTGVAVTEVSITDVREKELSIHLIACTTTDNMIETSSNAVTTESESGPNSFPSAKPSPVNDRTNITCISPVVCGAPSSSPDLVLPLNTEKEEASSEKPVMCPSDIQLTPASSPSIVSILNF